MFGRQFPEVWRCPRGGFWHVESEFAVKNNKFIQPGSNNYEKTDFETFETKTFFSHAGPIDMPSCQHTQFFT